MKQGHGNSLRFKQGFFVRLINIFSYSLVDIFENPLQTFISIVSCLTIIWNKGCVHIDVGVIDDVEYHLVFIICR